MERKGGVLGRTGGASDAAVGGSRTAGWDTPRQGGVTGLPKLCSRAGWCAAAFRVARGGDQVTKVLTPAVGWPIGEFKAAWLREAGPGWRKLGARAWPWGATVPCPFLWLLVFLGLCFLAARAEPSSPRPSAMLRLPLGQPTLG